MAFDADGHRLGRGKGYYDRFLSKLSALHTKLYKIGLCFPWQLVDEVPSDAHDIMMDGVISQNAHQ
jgi:5-formyltetrahydrofolate cyclo-ligase